MVGDATDSATVGEILKICEAFDIIVDDGSHLSNDILNNFLIYFPMVKPGGLFVIEDTHTLYMNNWGGGVLNEFSAYSFFKKLIDIVNVQFWGDELSMDVYCRTFFPLGQMPAFIKEGWVESIEFRNSIIVIRKSETATHDKLGERIVTGSRALVNDNLKNPS